MTLTDDLTRTAALLAAGWPITSIARAKRAREQSKMGTRGLTAVILDGEIKIAQYGQWDHYPDGQGVRALTFCRDVLADDAKREAFIVNVRRCRFTTDADIDEAEEWCKSIGIHDGWMDMAQSKKWHERFPLWTRDHGAKILSLVAEHGGDGPIVLRNSWSFGADSLFCEWAYVVDLTAGTLEVYKGFNKGESVGRFASLPPDDDSNGDYKPVTLVATFQIGNLPTDAEFCAALNKSEDEE